MQQTESSGSEIEVTWEDQQNINKFGRLNNRLHELDDEIRTAKMKVVDYEKHGGPDVLRIKEHPKPTVKFHEIMIQVEAIGLNVCDTWLRQGVRFHKYGHYACIGFECSGKVTAVGSNTCQFNEGDEVCASLQFGGAYAEFVVVPEDDVLRIPSGISLVQAAALPEASRLTIYALSELKNVTLGNTILIHDTAGGIDFIAIQYAKNIGCKVFAVAGTKKKLRICQTLGAEICINYRKEDVCKRVKAETGEKGVDIILDVSGRDHFQKNMDCLAKGGSLVISGHKIGSRVDIDLSFLTKKGISIIGADVSNIGHFERWQLWSDVASKIWPLIEDGHIKPIIGKIFSFTEAAEAHRALEECCIPAFAGNQPLISIMRAMVLKKRWFSSILEQAEVQIPEIKDNEVMIKVCASGVNRGDIIDLVTSAEGVCPGLECSGLIEAVGRNADCWKVGERVCAILEGGGFAEKVVVPADFLLPLPDDIDLDDAASLAYASCSIWPALFEMCDPKRLEDKTILIREGPSGIGALAIQYAKHMGLTVIASTGSSDTFSMCHDYGADICLDHTSKSFVWEVVRKTGHSGVDFVLDYGASDLQRNIECCRRRGKVFIVDLRGMLSNSIDLAMLEKKQAEIKVFDLRSRDLGSKASVIAQVRTHLWPAILTKKVIPVVGNRFAVTEAQNALNLLKKNDNIGKIIVRMNFEKRLAKLEIQDWTIRHLKMD